MEGQSCYQENSTKFKLNINVNKSDWFLMNAMVKSNTEYIPLFFFEGRLFYQVDRVHCNVLFRSLWYNIKSNNILVTLLWTLLNMSQWYMLDMVRPRTVDNFQECGAILSIHT